MAEERIKQQDKTKSDPAQDRGRQELTPEQLAGVNGGTTEQVAKHTNETKAKTTE